MTIDEKTLIAARIHAVDRTTRLLLQVDEAQVRKERADRIRAMAQAHGTTPQAMFTGIIPLAKG
jgi:creatinine amidohydrolase/Fe(II)-dependent formamide hydrolase-like protein